MAMFADEQGVRFLTLRPHYYEMALRDSIIVASRENDKSGGVRVSQ
jgi:hypothetical protein